MVAAMPTEPDPITVAEVVRRAVELCDPENEDPDLGDLQVRFEDADEPVTSVLNFDERLADAVGEVDPEVERPAVSMAVAAALYLAHRRDALEEDPVDVLRLAARAEWKGDPPGSVVEWLADRGIAV
jgi:hypothetical protein